MCGGTASGLESEALALGSIPACAGEPGVHAVLPVDDAVYPRVCGGTDPDCIARNGQTGLSPRVRGNRWIMSSRAGDGRSIPACAGEPACQTECRLRAKVYPRVCGGNRRHVVRQPLRKRSIPACAGEPRRVFSRLGIAKVYPRVCGGTASTLRRAGARAGLSPRVRGNQWHFQSDCRPRRSIPACAGEPGRHGLPLHLPRVYPRVCGGTGPAATGVGSEMGLSPRVRGNPYATIDDAISRGSIPACAGEPLTDLTILHCREVYPRVCGGTLCT